jgi:hypothetical protein
MSPSELGPLFVSVVPASTENDAHEPNCSARGAHCTTVGKHTSSARDRMHDSDSCRRCSREEEEEEEGYDGMAAVEVVE